MKWLMINSSFPPRKPPKTIKMDFQHRINSASAVSQRRRLLQRQGRLRRTSEEPPALRKTSSLPLPGPSKMSVDSGEGSGNVSTVRPTQPTLQKHSSHPPMAQSRNRRKHESGSLQIRAVTVINRQSCSVEQAGTSFESDVAPRASHTPAMRSGPPLSCNFCWNTVDECGRILRRKTQYHCPECRTNLCIVPCFHEYHDSADSDPLGGAR